MQAKRQNFDHYEKPVVRCTTAHLKNDGTLARWETIIPLKERTPEAFQKIERLICGDKSNKSSDAMLPMMAFTKIDAGDKTKASLTALKEKCKCNVIEGKKLEPITFKQI